MNLTTENIIKMLAKNESAANILLERFNTLNDDERFEGKYLDFRVEVDLLGNK